MGFEGCVEYSAVGSVVNLAARLCGQARAGEILISQTARASIDGVVATEPAGELELKGLGAVSTWRVVAAGSPTVTRSLAVPPSASAPVRASDTNCLVRDGEDWLMSFDGTSIRLRDAKGLGYLATLLASPGREHHVVDLVGATEPAARTLAFGHAGELIDEQAKREYKRRLAELEQERDEASAFGDDERAAKADAEIDFITRELTSAYGLHGRARKAGDNGERMRKAVTNRVKDTITKIARVHPELGRHLTNTVRTGTFCSYVPRARPNGRCDLGARECSRLARPPQPDRARHLRRPRLRERGRGGAWRYLIARTRRVHDLSGRASPGPRPALVPRAADRDRWAAGRGGGRPPPEPGSRASTVTPPVRLERAARRARVSRRA